MVNHPIFNRIEVIHRPDTYLGNSGYHQIAIWELDGVRLKTTVWVHSGDRHAKVEVWSTHLMAWSQVHYIHATDMNCPDYVCATNPLRKQTIENFCDSTENDMILIASCVVKGTRS